jgi:hypothetical protein
MNVQAFDKLITDIRNCDPAKFNMRDHMTCMLSFLRPGEFTNTAEASDILGIPEEDSNRLFLQYCDQDKFPGGKIQPENAVRVLQHYKKTAEVDWSVARD